MVERVQIERVATRYRWCVLVAVGFCVAAGLLLAIEVIPELGAVLGAFFSVTAAIPLLFRRRVGFLVACWVAIVVIMLGGFLLSFLLAFVFIPATVPLLPVVVRRAGPGPRPLRLMRLRLARLTRHDIAQRLAIVTVIAGLMIFVAAITG
jgi:hypothetical protein